MFMKLASITKTLLRLDFYLVKNINNAENTKMIKKLIFYLFLLLILT